MVWPVILSQALRTPRASCSDPDLACESAEFEGFMWMRGPAPHSPLGKVALRHGYKAPVGIERKDTLAHSPERSAPEPLLGRGVQDLVPGLPHQEVGRTGDLDKHLVLRAEILMEVSGIAQEVVVLAYDDEHGDLERRGSGRVPSPVVVCTNTHDTLERTPSPPDGFEVHDPVPNHVADLGLELTFAGDLVCPFRLQKGGSTEIHR